MTTIHPTHVRTSYLTRPCRVAAPWLLLLALLAGLLLARPITAAPARPATDPCADRYEPDGVPAQAKPLGLSETQTHTVCPAGDADWLTFYAHRGSTYHITTTNQGPGVSMYLYLFAAGSQTVLARNDDAPGAQAPGQLQWTAPADGWYFTQAKNRGDTGSVSARYTLRLDGVPTATATPRPASPTPTLVPPTPVPPTATPVPVEPPPPATSLPAAPASSGVGTLVTSNGQILQPQPGDAGSDELPVFEAGAAAATAADKLAPNATFAQARLLIPGAVYRHLNFVGNPAAVAFFAWHAKPFDCYAAQTGDLSPGLDTALLLWRPAPTREGRKLLAQNDDSQAHSANLSSRVHWCNPSAEDTLVVLEVRNYAGEPVGGAAGKSYSLAVVIDPPPTATPRPTAPATGSNAGGSAGGSPPAGPPAPAGVQPLTINPPAPPARPTEPPPPTATPVPPSATASAIPSATSTATETATTTATATVTPTATPTPAQVTVDVVVYFANATGYGYGQALAGPDPGSGIPGLLVQVVDLHTNHPIPALDTLTDAYGHARLAWAWQGPVQLTVPQLLQTQLVQDRDLGLAAPGQAMSADTGHLYVPIRIQPYGLPIIHP